MQQASALIRPMRPDDVAAAEAVSAEAFLDLERRLAAPGDPEPQRRTPARATQWRTRTEHLLGTDPGGCWVAERDGTMLGFATSYRRETTWILATYAVLPGRQGAGIGTALLDAALTHSQGCLHGLLAASDDPRALRRYRLAGFDLHPQLHLSGVLDRTAIPPIDHVREGRVGDIELMDSLDRRTRGAAHGADHAVLRSMFDLLVCDRTTGSGYVYHDRGRPMLLAASNRRTATRMLWAALALVPPGERVEIAHVTAANQWALDVATAGRLSIGTAGHLALRGLRPPAPYLHHGTFL